MDNSLIAKKGKSKNKTRMKWKKILKRYFWTHCLIHIIIRPRHNHPTFLLCEAKNQANIRQRGRCLGPARSPGPCVRASPGLTRSDHCDHATQPRPRSTTLTVAPDWVQKHSSFPNVTRICYMSRLSGDRETFGRMSFISMTFESLWRKLPQ